MKNKILRVRGTIPYLSGYLKVFFDEVNETQAKEVKKLRKDEVSFAAFGGIFVKGLDLRRGDLFVIEG